MLRLEDFAFMYEQEYLGIDYTLPTECYHFPTSNPELQRLFSLLDDPPLLADLEDTLLPPDFPKSHHYCVTQSADYISSIMNNKSLDLNKVAFITPDKDKNEKKFGDVVTIFLMLKFFLFYISYPPTHMLSLHAFHIRDKGALYVYMKTLMKILDSHYLSDYKCTTHLPLSYLFDMHPQLSSTMSV